MSYRRPGKAAFEEQRKWAAWKQKHARLLAESGLPPGVLRSRRDWNYLLRYGYWCEGAYGEYINKIDFSLKELTPSQLEAFESLRMQDEMR